MSSYGLKLKHQLINIKMRVKSDYIKHWFNVIYVKFSLN